ncbi:MAG: PA0069 family radical SAM protein, partial [Planctomycetaceae bacterium]|nr:PA0069 family radical SAM protein [Planctomycetaceae bacterium]
MQLLLFARPTHEYYGLGAGVDFESKVFVREQAPQLFRDALASRRWVPEPVMISGVTDCYQPAERTFQLTRQCLEVALEARQPVALVTKNALITRDLDLLEQLAARNLVRAAISLTTLDPQLRKVLEPRTSSPQARLTAISRLQAAGVPVRVMVAPVIPGLNDSEIPAILQAAAEHGATTAAWILLRLPLAVKPVFVEWLERTQPLKKARIESLIRSTRQGGMNESQFGQRMRGSGEFAEQLGQTFRVFARKYNLAGQSPPLNCDDFRP